jgi:MOSC domain-containing protein YiiM
VADPVLQSVNVGLPRTRGVAGAADPMDRPWTSGIFKEAVAGPVWLGRANLTGDGQGDLKNHGGLDKAVNAYPADHYPVWRAELGLADFPPGAFGENFTIAGLTEWSACIGDIYAVGQARLQISQPRQPCWKLARRWRLRDLSARVERSGRTGWYFRVLAEGTVEAGLPLVLIERPFPRWTVADANDLMTGRTKDRAALAALAACPPLAAGWRETLARRAAEGGGPHPTRRLYGAN